MSTTSLEIRTNQNQLSRSSPISPVLSDMSRVRQGVLIDTACIIIALLSLTLFITLAGLTGYYADIEDYDTANQFFTSQNLTWLVWGSFYMIIMLYLWIRFIGVAWDNMSDLDRSHTIKRACAPLSSTKSMIKDTDRDNNSDQNNQSNDRNHEEETTDNDIISEYDEKLNDEDLINFIKPNYQNLFGNSIVTKYDDQFIPSPYPSNFKDNDNNSIIGTSSVPFINTNITITNDPLKNIPQHFRRQSDSSIIKQQKRSHSSSPIFLRNLNDSPKYSDETFHQELVIENPLSPTSTIATTIFDRRRSKFTSTTTSSDSITLSNSGGEVNIGRNNINRFNEGFASLPTTPTVGNVGNVNGNQQNNNLHNTSVRNQQLKEWLLKKPSPAIPRPQRLDSYRETYCIKDRILKDLRVFTELELKTDFI
ncbi:17552_t:CDS:2, partial [Gigaspora margarita]